MKKMSRFERSNNAHRRLFNKHIVVFGNLDSEIKANYHTSVLALQRGSQKILSRKEKQVVYKYERERIYGSKGKNSASSYLALFKKYNVKSL